ncbi:hypothetical protein GCM10008932_22160 [Alkalibacterium iburiense]|uniref:CAAX prenyl protease 2/Lysostaphin resistance protein A-like domain-containing protein n=1 Tax=Alkalibacterium iburiense TaxID=290589 RepID=A0ABN0XQF1_9LACT
MKFFEVISVELESSSPIPPPFLYRFILGVLIGPFVEEFFFRGILLNKWSERFGIKKAILFTSLLFMALHFNSFFIPQFIFS